jgi:hypothetical protein
MSKHRHSRECVRCGKRVGVGEGTLYQNKLVHKTCIRSNEKLKFPRRDH